MRDIVITRAQWEATLKRAALLVCNTAPGISADMADRFNGSHNRQSAEALRSDIVSLFEEHVVADVVMALAHALWGSSRAVLLGFGVDRNPHTAAEMMAALSTLVVSLHLLESPPEDPQCDTSSSRE